MCKYKLLNVILGWTFIWEMNCWSLNGTSPSVCCPVKFCGKTVWKIQCQKKECFSQVFKTYSWISLLSPNVLSMGWSTGHKSLFSHCPDNWYCNFIGGPLQIVITECVPSLSIKNLLFYSPALLKLDDLWGMPPYIHPSPSLIIKILQHHSVYILKLTLPVHKWHMDLEGPFQTSQPLPILLLSLVSFSSTLKMGSI